MKQIIFIGLLLLSVMRVSGQAADIDSLVNVLNTQVLTPDEKLQFYDQIADGFLFNDPGKAALYAQKGLALAEKEKNDLMASYFNEYIGISYIYTEYRKDSSAIYLERALKLAQKVKNENQETKLYLNLGVSYQSHDKLKSLEYYLKALDLTEKTGNKRYKATALGNIGTIHLSMNNKTQAVYFLEQAKELSEELDYVSGKIRAYHDLASIYNMEDDNLDKALDYAWKTVDLCKKVNNKNFQSTAMAILASTYNQLGENMKALECAEEAFKLAEELGDPSKKRTALMVLAEVYLEEKRYKDCEEAALEAWQMDSTSLDALTLSHFVGMANLFMGNKEKAADFFKRHVALDVTMADKTHNETLMDMEVKYETEKKEIRIASLEKEKLLYSWLGIGGILLAISLGVTLWQSIKNARKEKQLIAARSVMDGEMGERTRLARDLHDRLSGNLAALRIDLTSNEENLRNVSGKLDDCIDEIRRVAHNLMPVSLQSGLKTALEDYSVKFPNVRFHFFGEDRHIDRTHEYIVYCCVNELVNNSLKHSEADNIDVQLVQGEDYVALTVEDDGCGFDEKSVTKGIGLKSIRDRVASCGGKMDIRTSPGKGTEIIIQIKIR